MRVTRDSEWSPFIPKMQVVPSLGDLYVLIHGPVKILNSSYSSCLQTRVLQELRKWLIEGRNIPFIWLQPGAEESRIGGVPFEIRDGLLRGLLKRVDHAHFEEFDLYQSSDQAWCLQTTSTDGSKCSTWQHFPAGSDHIEAPLRCVGRDLMDLENCPRLVAMR